MGMLLICPLATFPNSCVNQLRYIVAVGVAVCVVAVAMEGNSIPIGEGIRVWGRRGAKPTNKERSGVRVSIAVPLMIVLAGQWDSCN